MVSVLKCAVAVAGFFLLITANNFGNEAIVGWRYLFLVDDQLESLGAIWALFEVVVKKDSCLFSQICFNWPVTSSRKSGQARGNYGVGRRRVPEKSSRWEQAWPVECDKGKAVDQSIN